MFSVGAWAGFVVRLIGGIVFSRWMLRDLRSTPSARGKAASWAWAAFFNWPLVCYVAGLKFRMHGYVWGGIAGFALLPFGVLWWSLPYCTAWYVFVAVAAIGAPIVWRALVRTEEEQRQRREETARSSLMARADAYLESMRISDEERITLAWEEGNRACAAGSSPLFRKVFVGSRTDVASKFKLKLERIWDNRFDSRSDERRERGEIFGMLNQRSESCIYDWGVNRMGLEIRRFGSDRYAYVEIFVDGGR